MLAGGRLDVLDWYHGWRLDVDNMSYEVRNNVSLLLLVISVKYNLLEVVFVQILVLLLWHLQQLLELGDRIGYVNTGLKDDEMGCCMRKIKLMNLGDLSHHFTTKTEWKCSICQVSLKFPCLMMLDSGCNVGLLFILIAIS